MPKARFAPIRSAWFPANSRREANVAGVGQGAGEPVELRDDEGVAGAECGESLV